MRVLFSIEFNYNGKLYCGIVRVTELADHTAYHVRIMNNRLDHWLYGYNEFRTSGGALPYETSNGKDRTEKLRQAVYEGLHNWLQKRVSALPPQAEARKAGNDRYYVHSILPTAP